MPSRNDTSLSRSQVAGGVGVGLVSAVAPATPSPRLFDTPPRAPRPPFEWLAEQLASKGIRVTGVVPWPIWIPLRVSGGATQDKLQAFGGTTPLERPGQPAELGGIDVQLAPSEASCATGQIYGTTRGSGQP